MRLHDEIASFSDLSCFDGSSGRFRRVLLNIVSQKDRLHLY